MSFPYPHTPPRPACRTAGQKEGFWKIIVGNVSRHANDHYLQEFFACIGVIHGSSLHYSASTVSTTGYAELLFARQEEALAAGKMTGWSICNEAIVVSSPEYCPISQLRSAPHSAVVAAQARGFRVQERRRSDGSVSVCSAEPDWIEETVERKNLYVLNLPIDMTNEEMLKLFQPFGTVVHSCILAILDSSARRRGFILMSSGVEATAAMRNLHGQVYRDYVLDVSYSVVQKTAAQKTAAQKNAAPDQMSLLRPSRSLTRAQPPAHHYDALRAIGQPVGRISGSEDDRDFWAGLPRAAGGVGGSGATGQAQQEQGWEARKVKRIVTNGAGADGFKDDAGVLVDNLSPVVFRTPDDIEALFGSFGRVLAVDVFPSLLEDRPNAAVIKFELKADAERAKRSLEGKLFGGREILMNLLDSPVLPRQPLSAPASGADWLSQASSGPSSAQPNGHLRQPSLHEALTPTRLHFPPSADASSAATAAAALVRDIPGQDLDSSPFDPFSPFDKPDVRAPPRIGRQISKDTVELIHPLPTNLSLNAAPFPPPPHSFADTLTPRPHYSSPPPAPPRPPKHEGGMGYLRTAGWGAFEPSPAAGHGYGAAGASGSNNGVSPSATATAGADDPAESDASTFSDCASSPDSALGSNTWWRRGSTASSSSVAATPGSNLPPSQPLPRLQQQQTQGHDHPLVQRHEKSHSGSSFTYFAAAGAASLSSSGVAENDDDDGDVDALGAGFAALGAGGKDEKALTEVALGSSLSSVL